MPTLISGSPCIGECALSKHKLCKGCGRSKEEIESWKKLDREARHEINLRLLATRGKAVRKKLLADIKRAAQKAKAKKEK
jgi:predicted Fe-S protein YdhL (DUF1289 family)